MRVGRVSEWRTCEEWGSICVSSWICGEAAWSSLRIRHYLRGKHFGNGILPRFPGGLLLVSGQSPADLLAFMYVCMYEYLHIYTYINIHTYNVVVFS